jgi:hypothetical protein
MIMRNHAPQTKCAQLSPGARFGMLTFLRVSLLQSIAFAERVNAGSDPAC